MAFREGRGDDIGVWIVFILYYIFLYAFGYIRERSIDPYRWQKGGVWGRLVYI